MLNALEKLREQARKRREWRNAILVALGVLIAGPVVLVGVVLFFEHFFLA